MPDCAFRAALIHLWPEMRYKARPTDQGTRFRAASESGLIDQIIRAVGGFCCCCCCCGRQASLVGLLNERRVCVAGDRECDCDCDFAAQLANRPNCWQLATAQDLCPWSVCAPKTARRRFNFSQASGSMKPRRPKRDRNRLAPAHICS